MDEKIIDSFVPRNATMQYALSNSYERIKLHDNLNEILDEVRHANSIMDLLYYCKLSDTNVVQALSDNLRTLAELISHIEGDLYIVTEYGLCTQADKQKAIHDRKECVARGLCDGKCENCNDGYETGGDCKCNIIGSNGYQKIFERGNAETVYQKGDIL